MSGFKLLAIRTGKKVENIGGVNENNNFLKILKPYTLYKFYNECKFIVDENTQIEDGDIRDIESLEYNLENQLNLFSTDSLDINISALVGKNGSGKSTLLELYFLAIYLLAVRNDILDVTLESLKSSDFDFQEDKEKWEKEKQDFTSRDDKIQSLLDDIKGSLAEIPEKELKFYPGYDILSNKLKQVDRTFEDIGGRIYIDRHEKWIKDQRTEINRLVTNFELEIFYELNSTCYSLSIKKQNEGEEYVKFRVIPSNLPEPEPEHEHELNSTANARDIVVNNLLSNPINLSDHFFYTIAVSYSHHGLNADIDGDWLNGLFHKNDSYQTPLVINPMRTSGKIDIVKENNLVRQRLLSNLLEPIVKDDPDNLRVLAPLKTAKKLLLKFNERKFSDYVDKHGLSKVKKIENIDDCIKKLYFKYTGKKLVTNDEPTLLGTNFYMRDKLVRICTIYPRYQKYLSTNSFNDIPNLVEDFIKDKSHITYKLKQAMNFVSFKLIAHKEAYKEFEVDIDTLSKMIQAKIGKSDKMTIEFLPPPTFDVRIQLDDGTSFERMSSGEKQKIYSISSIVYHIININSASKNGSEDNAEFYKYKYINILFDEVEQYFHPDLQRTFIYDLHEYLKRMTSKHIDKIKGVNILFATHSPFILSDIPSSNILRLNDGKPEPNKERTFGANIHDLLDNSFFMHSTMGEFSLRKIQSFIDFYYKVRDSKEEQVSLLKSEFEDKKEEFEFLRNHVGEDVYREILDNHYTYIEETLNPETMERDV